MRQRGNQGIFQSLGFVQHISARRVHFQLQPIGTQSLDLFGAGRCDVGGALQREDEARDDDAGEHETDQNDDVELRRHTQGTARWHEEPVDGEIAGDQHRGREPEIRFPTRADNQQEIHQHPVRDAQLRQFRDGVDKQRDHCIHRDPSTPRQDAGTRPTAARSSVRRHDVTMSRCHDVTVTVRRSDTRCRVP